VNTVQPQQLKKCIKQALNQQYSKRINDIDSVKNLAEQSIEFLGGLDALVNNAGITMNLPFEKVTPEQFDTL